MIEVNGAMFDSLRQARRYARGVALRVHGTVAILRNGAKIAEWFFSNDSIKFAEYRS